MISPLIPYHEQASWQHLLSPTMNERLQFQQKGGNKWYKTKLRCQIFLCKTQKNRYQTDLIIPEE